MNLTSDFGVLKFSCYFCNVFQPNSLTSPMADTLRKDGQQADLMFITDECESKSQYVSKGQIFFSTKEDSQVFVF